jgi:ubiquinone/menaquinone biosynthesis C-methylase UbiE
MTQPDERTPEGLFTFDPFAQHQFYVDVNRALVWQAIERLDRTHPPGAPLRIAELASGTGAVTELILNAVAQYGRTAVICGVEPSQHAIALAEQRLAGHPVSFIQGDVSAIGDAVGPVDAAFFCNAIHLIADKDPCVAALAELLMPGGILAFNTTFYEGAYVTGSQPFYYALTRQSIGWLHAHYPDMHLAHRGKTTARQWLSSQEYRDLVGRHGLDVALLEEVPVRLSLLAIQDIGAIHSSSRAPCRVYPSKSVLKPSTPPLRGRLRTCTRSMCRAAGSK